MVFSCFNGSSRRDSEAFDPEPVARKTTMKKRSTFQLRRVATNTPSVSSSRTSSNASIAQLPPCPHLDDPKIDALMMPVPNDGRQSRCLRLSYPKIYSNIVTDMKEAKGCRDWRNFAVFEADDVDDSISADDLARKKSEDYEKKMAAFGSF
ncbi:hypothetical protein AMS68_003615 [Peltaster fructicola]|uniref:Uncharacterized protein n=1 Tax=Peltaster fructicola TaxID=286661 RepID=A0A6H0XU08_9PEZI|nr:hypothetical protein AMS68_003615 [Peltaster fructicola]